jgi:hypothetical protein
MTQAIWPTRLKITSAAQNLGDFFIISPPLKLDEEIISHSFDRSKGERTSEIRVEFYIKVRYN